ncbi:response regulator transcription factor [Lacipirellula sp.]|uniref:response regulator transcription factor n=1 Tax=Lacipirellula sp. TaxID=2691419 RepID=UPI003D0E3177
MSDDQPTVYVVDDDAQARKAVTTLIEAMGVATLGFNSAEEFLTGYDGRRPACLVTDVRMIGMSGLELQEELIRRGVDISVVVLTGFATTPGTVRAMKNGALTLLEKPCRDDELWEAIRDGLTADRAARSAQANIGEIQTRFDNLTVKERDVLSHVAAGEANKVIARRMDVSLRTVELHRQNVFQKMGADSLAELVRMVVALEGEKKPPAGS